MKRSPQKQKLEAMLRSSVLVAEGFMGHDHRSVDDIVDADRAALARCGISCDQVARRMREITETAVPFLGNWVDVGPGCRAKVDEVRGRQVCPWGHRGGFAKRLTTVQTSTKSGETRELMWSDLNIHLISEHGFFEGCGSRFRLEPGELAEVLFSRKD